MIALALAFIAGAVFGAVCMLVWGVVTAAAHDDPAPPPPKPELEEVAPASEVVERFTNHVRPFHPPHLVGVPGGVVEVDLRTEPTAAEIAQAEQDIYDAFHIDRGSQA